MNAFTLWPDGTFTITQGKEFVGTDNKTPRRDRQFCRKCRGHLMTYHPHWTLMDIYAATIPTVAFRPGVHMNYAGTVLPMKDGLPKMKDLPSGLGGLGEPVPE